ncbi:MAG: SDR family oxidoreductase, partial [Planctomycetota bacterium]|nr:SDR family oxidoreductase [Planctomycetota bacterium]
MKVLITGHQGYIGCHAVDLFKAAGHQVLGVDIGYFSKCLFDSTPSPDQELLCDIGDLSASDLAGVDAIVHFAAISNDPMGELAPELTRSTNIDKTIRLAEIAKGAGVSKFIFSSSCAVYGDSHGQYANENHELAPQTEYAKSKVIAERELLKLNSNEFCVIILRNATAYGYSPALRTDLVFNDFVAGVAVNNQIKLLSDGSAYRPFIHARDMANVFLCATETNCSEIGGQILNVGSKIQTIKILDLAQLIKNQCDDVDIIFADENNRDERNYLVNFERFESLFPNFNFENSFASETQS